MPKRITIVDDEANIGLSLHLILEREGYAINVCHSLAELKAGDGGPAPDLYLLDVCLPDGNGIDALRALRKAFDSTPVIMISGHGTISDAVAASHAGAFDFLEKPLARDRVLLAVKNAIDHAALQQENARYREIIGDGPRLIGKSPVFVAALEQADLVARSDARVLLTGESGTGKELLAERIHRQSPFSSGPFVKVNCAAIPTELLESELFGHEKGSFTGASGLRRGKFELASGGSIFLDEVGDLYEGSQAKLLRVLQEGEFQRVGGEKTLKVQVRVISATNRNLPELVAQKRFREDLFYRLNVVPIRVPPLRERVDDISALADYFLADFCDRNNFRRKTFDGGVLAVLQTHSWPGNARELRNVVERMVILTNEETIPPEAVPLEIRMAADSKSSLQEVRDSAERDRIVKALEAADWNVSAAARGLGVERTSLHKRIRALGLSRE